MEIPVHSFFCPRFFCLFVARKKLRAPRRKAFIFIRAICAIRGLVRPSSISEFFSVFNPWLRSALSGRAVNLYMDAARAWAVEFAEVDALPGSQDELSVFNQDATA